LTKQTLICVRETEDSDTYYKILRTNFSSW